MQRINLLTNPNFAGPLTDINRWGTATASVDNKNHQLIVSGTSGGYGLHVNVPKGVELVLRMFIYTDVSKMSNPPVTVMDVDSNNNITVLGNITPTANASTNLKRITSKTGRIRIEAYPADGTTVNLGEVLVERADTYDKAVGGGASGLLHRRHHAIRLNRHVGRVTADESREHDIGSVSHLHLDQWHVHAGLDDRQKGGHQIRVFRVGARFRRDRAGRPRLPEHTLGHPYHTAFHQLFRGSDECLVPCLVRFAHSHGQRSHAGRGIPIPGVQGSVGPARMVRWGHDAPDLTLAMGAVA